MKVESESEVAQSCLTLSDSMDCSPPGSSAHGIFQARVLEWGAIAFSDSVPSLWHIFALKDVRHLKIKIRKVMGRWRALCFQTAKSCCVFSFEFYFTGSVFKQTLNLVSRPVVKPLLLLLSRFSHI